MKKHGQDARKDLSEVQLVESRGMSESRARDYKYLLLFLALLLTGIPPVAYELGNTVAPYTLNLLVAITGTAVSAILMLTRGTQGRLRDLLSWKGLIAVSSFGIGAYTFLTIVFAVSTHVVSADLVAVVYRTWPLMLILMSPVLLNDRWSWYDLAGAAVAFLSLPLIILRGTLFSIPLSYLPFITLLLMGALADALASAVSKKFQYELTSSIFAYNLTSLVVFTLISVRYGLFDFSGFTASTLVAVLVLGCIQNVALTFVFVSSLRKVKTSLVVIYILSPAVTMVLSVMFLGTPLEPYYALIFVMVAAGIGIQSLGPAGTKYIRTRSPAPD